MSFGVPETVTAAHRSAWKVRMGNMGKPMPMLGYVELLCSAVFNIQDPRSRMCFQEMVLPNLSERSRPIVSCLACSPMTFVRLFLFAARTANLRAIEGTYHSQEPQSVEVFAVAWMLRHSLCKACPQDF